MLTSTTSTNAVASTDITLEKVLDAIALLKMLETEPARVFMISKGFAPESGGRLVLPERVKAALFPWGAPKYVLFSKITEQALLFRDPLFDLSPRR